MDTRCIAVSICYFANTLIVLFVGATFYYSPEANWGSLLKQRRRWLNGTFAANLFFFFSSRATERVSGGMFDGYKNVKSKRLVNFFYGIILVQLILTLFSSAIFGSTSYISLKYLGTNNPDVFGWERFTLFEMGEYKFCIRHLWVVIFMLFYTYWVYYSHRNATIPERMSVCYACVGIIYMLPVYYTVFYSSSSVINVIVIVNMFIPAILALFQSATSALLYVAYLPWFILFVIMFIVFFPSYSAARLWDTTWGNRDTGHDSKVNEEKKELLKQRTAAINVALVAINWGLMCVFINLYTVTSNTYHLVYMAVLFAPVLIQTTIAFTYYCLIIPLQACFGNNRDTSSSELAKVLKIIATAADSTKE